MLQKRIATYLRRVLLLIISLFCITIGILHLPIVQNSIFKKYLLHLNNKTNHTFTYKHFQISWLRYTSINELVIKDPEKKILCKINHVNFTINPIQIIINQCITIDHVHIDGAQIQLEYNAQGKLNITLLIEKLFGYNSFCKKSYSINKVIFQGVYCSLYHPKNKLFWLYKNPDHYVYCNNMQGTLTQISLQDNVLAGKIIFFTCKTSNNPLLNALMLKTDFEISPYALQFKELRAKVADSFMEGTCSLQSKNQSLLQNITQFAYQNIKITFLLKNSTFTSHDLALFIPALNQKNTIFKLNGKLIGTLQEFFIQNFQLQFGDKNSNLQGNSRFKKEQKDAKAIFRIFLDQGKLHAADILTYIPQIYHSYITPFQYFTIKNGSLIGDLGNVPQYTMQGDIKTTLGEIVIHKMLITPKNIEKDFTYQGSITTKDLNIGSLFRNQTLGKLSMQAKMIGKNIQPDKVTLQLKANINKLGVYNYDYQNIHINGMIMSKQIEGSIKIRDKNLQCNASVRISNKNCNDTNTSLLLTGTLHHASLQPLNFLSISIPIQMRTQFKLDMRDFSLANPIGILQLDQFYCTHHHNNEIIVRRLKLCSEKHQSGFKLKMDSSLLNLVIVGNFRYPTLLHDFKKLLYPVKQDQYQRLLPVTTPQSYFFNYTIQLKKILPLLKWYFPNLNLVPDIMLAGSFAKGKEVEFSLNIPEISTITYKKHALLNTKLDIKGTQLQNEKLRSLTIKLSGKFKKKNQEIETTALFSLKSSLQGNQLILEQNLISNEQKYLLYLYGEGILSKDFITIKLNPSITLLKISDNLWKIDPNNLLIVKKNTIQFKHFKLSNNNQIITLSGTLSTHKDEVLKIQIKNLQLNNLDNLLNTKVHGTIDAVGIFRGIFQHIVFDGNAIAQNIVIDTTTIGDFYLNTMWSDLQNKLNIYCQLYQEKKQVIELKGFYHPTSTKNNLSLALNLRAMQATSFTPFVKDLFSDLHGTLSGDFIISGSPSQIQVDGQGLISHVMFKIDYLNTSYHIHNPFICSNQTIYFNDIKVTDNKSGTATLKGSIFYKKKEGFHMDLKGNLQNLYILNTTQEENENFYGSGIVTGTITLVGPLYNIMIRAHATTDQGILTIRTNNKQNTIQNRIVQFRNLKSLKKEKKISPFSINPKKKSKITLSLDLQITSALETIVLFNSEQNNFLKGYGHGTIKIEVGNEKSLRLTGNYRFQEGTCHFFMYGLIRKVFKLQGENKVIWNNDLYSGILNLQAVYKQEVTLLPLLNRQDTITDATRIPVEVLLNIQGTLLTPLISFGLNFTEMPKNQELSSKIEIFKYKISTDKSYLDSQIFSLIAFKRFFNNDLLSLHKAIGVRMSEFIEEQLNTLSSQIDDNFEIQSNLGLQDWKNFKNNFFQNSKIRLSYYFLNKNLCISSVIGSNSFLFNDLMIIYKINKNMNIRLYSIPSEGLGSRGGGGVSFSFIKNLGK